MTVYRIGNPAYINRLDGEGAAQVGGRWNQVGQRMIYTAETSSLAILEVLGHISNPQFYIPYQLVEITIEAKHVVDYSTIHPDLPEGWSSHQAGEKITRSIGSDWLSQASSPYLRVPSVHNPLERNYLLNPTHPQFEAKVTSKHWYLYHDRLVKK